MNRSFTVLAGTASALVMALLLVVSATPLRAADEPVADLAKGAIDPLDLGRQRALFLRAAGVDTELDQGEFDVDQKADSGFVRSFDQFKGMLAFDRNGNKKLDWFETDAYRRDIRSRILSEYDEDKNGRLTGPERDEANKALAAGKIPAAARTDSGDNSGRGDNARGPRPDNRPDNRRPGDRFGGDRTPLTPEQIQNQEAITKHWEDFRAKAREEHDTNGNGQIDGDEREAYARAYRQEMQRRINEKYDVNGNGQIDDDERDAVRQAFAQRRQYESEKRRKDYLDRYDEDGDGELSEDERNAAREDQIKRYQLRRYDRNGDGILDDEEQAVADEARKRYEEERAKRREAMLDKYDKDGDGELNEEERREMFRNESRGRRPGGRGAGGPSTDRVD